MFERFKKKKNENTAQAQDTGSDDDKARVIWEKSVALQEEYWTFNVQEKENLLKNYPTGISWSETIRLHHLACMELLALPEVQKQLNSDSPDDESELPDGEVKTFCTELVERLLEPQSPFRVHHAAIWQNSPGSQDREHDIEGQFLNASITHLGSLEVFKVDEDFMPVEIEFIPFDTIRGAIFANNSLLRMVKIFFEYGREEEVFLTPLLYGISHQTGKEFYKDGSFTGFIAHLGIQNSLGISGIGVGHQDFVAAGENNSGASLFGLGSINELMMSLNTADTNFEEKCRSRGLDPNTVLNNLH
ncbi:MAG: hypothetical protein GY754_12830 [bacterium]|nr:hypothetical protein [bacterium]